MKFSLGGFLDKHSSELSTISSALELLLLSLPIPAHEKTGILGAVTDLKTSVTNIAAAAVEVKALEAAHGSDAEPEETDASEADAIKEATDVPVKVEPTQTLVAAPVAPVVA